MSRRATLASCALGAALAASPALARPGCVHQDAFLFTDPTYTGNLIGTIPAPAPVEVVRTGPKWSIISYDGESGYVATRHLSPASGARSDPPPGRYYDASRTMRREIDPLFDSHWLNGGRFAARGRPFGGYWSGSNYFAGFRRSYWTDRVNWRRESYLAPDDPAWAACGAGAAPGRRRR
ncbi:hypothetical protein [Methylocystis sp. S23]